MFSVKQRNGRSGVGLAVLASVAVLAGCGKSSTGSDLPNGGVSVALATTGSDGATYQFSTGDFLQLFNTSTGFSGFFPIDGSETVLSETVPIGSYQALLSISGSGSLQLVRTLNGMSQTVAATWTDPQPFDFNVLQNMTTPIVLHFSVVGVGDVTFQLGRVQVSIDVNATSAAPNNGQESGTVTVSNQTIAPGLGLETPLGLTVGEIDGESITVALTGPFAPTSPQFACASATLTAIAAPMSSTAFSALVEELQGTPASGAFVCVFDNGATDVVELEVFRFGSAPADQQAFLPGNNYQFFGLVEFSVGDIYDGTTLKLSQLGAPIALGSANGAFWDHQIFDFDTGQGLESSFGGINGGTFQLTP